MTSFLIAAHGQELRPLTHQTYQRTNTDVPETGGVRTSLFVSFVLCWVLPTQDPQHLTGTGTSPDCERKQLPRFEIFAFISARIVEIPVWPVSVFMVGIVRRYAVCLVLPSGVSQKGQEITRSALDSDGCLPLQRTDRPVEKFSQHLAVSSNDSVPMNPKVYSQTIDFGVVNSVIPKACFENLGRKAVFRANPDRTSHKAIAYLCRTTSGNPRYGFR